MIDAPCSPLFLIIMMDGRWFRAPVEIGTDARDIRVLDDNTETYVWLPWAEISSIKREDA